MKLFKEGNSITLEQFFKENQSLALGFSGGVDSSYLLYAAIRAGAGIKAYFVKTAFQPEFELEDARRLAKQTGAEITVLEANVLDNPQIASNPPDRCYYCKKFIFETISAKAVLDGMKIIIDGTNASDDINDRSGIKALSELCVRSPLRECGITKREERRLSKEAGLFTWNKPAYACLATRVPCGRAITKDLLFRIEKSEDALFAFGFTDFRVRVMGDAAKLQFPAGGINAVLEKRGDILKAIKPYFDNVLLDLEERGGRPE